MLLWCFQVTVNTNIADLNDYLQHILSSTNMKCLTPEKVSAVVGVTSSVCIPTLFKGYFYIIIYDHL